MMQPPQHPQENMYNPDRDTTPSHGTQPMYPGHEAMYPTDNYQQDAIRDLPPMRDASRDFMAEPPMRDPAREMRRDTSRETRREPGRDMRDAARDVRREPNRDMMMRPSGRESMRPEPMRDNMRPEPMRDNRPYMQEGPDYGDNDQNLLPPVASLM